jgi:hypothetical protein
MIRPWSLEDHERAERLLRRNASSPPPQEGLRRTRTRGGKRCRLTAEETAQIDSLVRVLWENADVSVEDIASRAGRTAPVISKRARALGFAPRRHDRRKP